MNNTDVLILTASFGNGHNSATKAIREELEKEDSNLNIIEKDMFEVTTPRLKDYLFETYRLLTRKHPSWYNRLYRLRSESSVNIVDELMLQLYFDRFVEFMDVHQPRVVVSVFPTCASFASKYKDRFNPDLKLITCITDVIDNWEWLHLNTDKYFVPSEEVKQNLIRKGVPYCRIVVTGIPVRNAFKEVHKADHHKQSKQLLIVASAMEKLELDSKTLELINSLDRLKTIIITGNNRKLYKRLNDYGSFENITVIGYTTDMARIMAESDLILSKAGGATIFEAISLELPLLIKASEVGQEDNNVQFIKANGIGDSIDVDEDVVGKLSVILSNEEYTERLQENIRVLKESLEPQRIAPEINKLC